VPTILDRLQRAGLSWRIYGATASQAGSNQSLSNGYAWSICPTIAECLYTSQDRNLVSSARFNTDASKGALPAFSVVTPGGPTFPNSCHNAFSITACDNWVGALVKSAEDGPDWSSTAIFITFDDFGGFYDSVPPPVNPDGTQEGPRVPLIIVSPYARPGYTDTTQASFASILAFTEHDFGLAPLSVNDATTYRFNNAFNYSRAPLHPARVVTRPLPTWARHIHLIKRMLDDPS